MNTFSGLVCPVCGELATHTAQDTEMVGIEFVEDDGKCGVLAYPLRVNRGEPRYGCDTHTVYSRNYDWDAKRTNDYIAVNSGKHTTQQSAAPDLLQPVCFQQAQVCGAVKGG